MAKLKETNCKTKIPKAKVSKKRKQNNFKIEDRLFKNFDCHSIKTEASRRKKTRKNKKSL